MQKVKFPKYPKSIKNPEIKFSAGYNPDTDNVLKKNGYYISSTHANQAELISVFQHII